MAKERFLTILVPITDTDVTPKSTNVVGFSSFFELQNSIAPSEDNVNNIYKVDNGGYYRPTLNEDSNQYHFVSVVDREFPYIGKPLEIFDFTYTATRMGKAPTISAQNVMWFANKDEQGRDVTLEGLWSQVCHVSFNGENFYLKRVPSSTKDNQDARYKYDIDFISERFVLENVYVYDVVAPYISESHLSESSEFSFYGDIYELAKRINASLLKSGLTSIITRENITRDQYLTYAEFNGVGVGTYQGGKDTSDPYPEVSNNVGQVVHRPHQNIYEHFDGNYDMYLLNRVYVVDEPKFNIIGNDQNFFIQIYDGKLRTSGYKCVVGKDKLGNDISTEEKLIQFENKTIYEALQYVYDTFDLQYYIYKDGDDTIIKIADCEYDFADKDNDGQLIRNEEGIPTSTNPFDYGVDGALISKQKNNTTDKIITRITGIGSSTNIPWYYPNPTPDGWIRPRYERDGSIVEEQDVIVDYPKQDGTTQSQIARYEKYIKNRIGIPFEYGKIADVRYFGTDTLTSLTLDTNTYKKITLTIEVSFDYDFSTDLYEVDSEQFGLYVEHVLVYKFDESLVSAGNLGGWQWNGDWEDLDDFRRNVFTSGTYQFNVVLASVNAMSHFSNEYWMLPNDYFDGQTRYSLLIPKGALSVEEIKTIYINYNYESGYVWYYRAGGSGGYRAICSTFGRWVDVPGAVLLGSNRSYSDIGSTYNNVRIILDRRYDNLGWDGKFYNVTYVNRYGDYSTEIAVGVNDITAADVYRKINGRIRWWKLGWFRDGKAEQFSDYGLSVSFLNGFTPQLWDSIKFQRVKYVTPQKTLMPELYVKTDGERRFYSAHNYFVNGRLLAGNADLAVGEKQVGAKVKNDIYKKDEDDPNNKHYVFENEYVPNLPFEHIEKFDDIQPSIKEMKYNNLRIDVVETFAYDQLDDNEIWADDSEGSGEYKHPYFFAKLRPMGFNIFDMALQDDMVLSLTTGACGACNFKIGVDENTKKNPVQIWEYDVYEGSSFDNRTLRYSKGDLRRYVDTTNLYYDTNGTSSGYVSVNSRASGGLLVSRETSFQYPTYTRELLSASDVANGYVGSLKKNNKIHFEGDVKVSGRFIEYQQDTTNNYVWIALYKDVETYGVLMPNAQPDYGDSSFSRYIEPKGAMYINRKTNEEVRYSDDDADKFVLTNIRLPQAYLRSAERYLSRKLVAYMYDNNYQKFNFSINFSRIFIAQNPSIDAKLNENSVLYVSFNNKVYRQYVKTYTYKMTKDTVLPEVSVELNEEIAVSRTTIERQSLEQERRIIRDNWRLRRDLDNTTSRISRNTIGRNEDAIINGNIIVRDNATSINDLHTATESLVSGQLSALFDMDKVNLDLNRQVSNFARLVLDLNNFNDGVEDRLKQIRKTIEKRLATSINGGHIGICPGKQVWNDGKTDTLFWLDNNGVDQAVPQSCSESNGMTDIHWDEFNENEESE